MSAASAQNLQQAALVAAAVANSLGAAPAGGAPMTLGSAAAILGAVVQAGGPLISPQATAAIGLATLALSAIHVAQQSNSGLTAEQIAATFAADLTADDKAIAADQAAQAAAAAAAK